MKWFKRQKKGKKREQTLIASQVSGWVIGNSPTLWLKDKKYCDSEWHHIAIQGNKIYVNGICTSRLQT